jgi:hypothetical protein
MLTTPSPRRASLLWIASWLAAGLAVTTALLCVTTRSLAGPILYDQESNDGVELQTDAVPYAIRGKVSEDGLGAVADALVTAEPGGFLAVTNASGAYTLTVSTSATAAYTVTAGKSGYVSPAPRVVTVPPSRTAIDFQFPHR